MDGIDLIFAIHRYSSDLNLAKAPFNSIEVPVSTQVLHQMLHSKEKLTLRLLKVKQ